MNYVVARPWGDEEDEGLCIYAYGSEVHQGGTLKEARSMLAYVRRQKDEKGDWAIYEVTFKKVK